MSGLATWVLLLELVSADGTSLTSAMAYASLDACRGAAIETVAREMGSAIEVKVSCLAPDQISSITLPSSSPSTTHTSGPTRGAQENAGEAPDPAPSSSGGADQASQTADDTIDLEPIGSGVVRP